MSYLSKLKSTSGQHEKAIHHSDAATRLRYIFGFTPNDDARNYIMRVMVNWNERAAMMTCGSVQVEQAEMAAWHDLKLDNIFWVSEASL